MFFLRLNLVVFGFAALAGCSTLSHNTQQKWALVNIQLGMNAIEAHDYREAYQKLSWALKNEPYLPEAWYSMAYFYEKTNQGSFANQYYLRAIIYGPERMDVHNNYGRYLCRKEHFRAAVQQFKLAVSFAGPLEKASVYVNAGFCALKIPNRPLALDYFKNALANDPESHIAAEQIQKLTR